MKELMILSVIGTKMETIIEDLKDACYDYEENPSEETVDRVKLFAQLVLTKSIVGEDVEKAVHMIKELEKAERTADLLNPDLN